MNNPELTIVIPTYNRKENLLRTIVSLLPQVYLCKILIIDNASTYDVQSELEHITGDNPYKDKICLIRNKINIGMCANILRCYEMVDTEWMWLLSDDDSPKDNAVKIILEDIEKYKESIFLNYSTELHMRDKDRKIVGVEEFMEKVDSFPNVLFVSAGVYNVKKILPSLRYGYIFSYSLAPHIALLLMSIGKDQSILLRKEQIVNWNPPKGKEQWSNVTMAINLPTLLELPLNLDKNYFKLFANMLNCQAMHPYNAFRQIILFDDVDVFYTKRLFRQIYFRRHETNNSINPFKKIGLKNIIAFVINFLPMSIWRLIKYLCKGKNKSNFFNRL